jgi:flagellar hook-basal body complex protein FliE
MAKSARDTSNYNSGTNFINQLSALFNQVNAENQAVNKYAKQQVLTQDIKNNP